MTIFSPGTPNSTTAQTNDILHLSEIPSRPAALPVASPWTQSLGSDQNAGGLGWAEEAQRPRSVTLVHQGGGQTCICDGLTPGDLSFCPGLNVVNTREAKTYFYKVGWALRLLWSFHQPGLGRQPPSFDRAGARVPKPKARTAPTSPILH